MEVIASRVLVDPVTGSEFHVSVAKPAQKSAIEWICEFSVSSPSGPSSGYACGGDSIQALMLCMDAIRNELSRYPEELNWDGLPLALAFPRTLPISLGEEFYYNIESQVEHEIGKYVDAASKRRGK